VSECVSVCGLAADMTTSVLKKFGQEDVMSQNVLKGSVQRQIKNAVVEAYPPITPYINQIFPKKGGTYTTIKCREHITLITINGEVAFFQIRTGPFIPTLRLLHKYPFMLPRFQADRGAIKFLFSGAQCMCPGLTSPGGSVPDGIAENQVVAIYVEGKENALAIGTTILSSDNIRKVNRGPALDNLHCLNDGLWTFVPQR